MLRDPETGELTIAVTPTQIAVLLAALVLWRRRRKLRSS